MATRKPKSEARRRRRPTRKSLRSELLRYGPVKWVPVQWIEPPHSARYPSHLERIVRSMRRNRSPSRGGCMWTGRPLLVEAVAPGSRFPGVRYVSWTGSHRIAAAFASGQWLVPIIEIDLKLWTKTHGKPATCALTGTTDDTSRLTALLPTGDERAIRLMRREIPVASKDRKLRAERQRQQRKIDDALWSSLGPRLEARVLGPDLISLRHKATRDEMHFQRDVLDKLLEQFELQKISRAG